MAAHSVAATEAHSAAARAMLRRGRQTGWGDVHSFHLGAPLHRLTPHLLAYRRFGFAWTGSDRQVGSVSDELLQDAL